MKKILFINDFGRGGGAEVIFNQTINVLKDNFICKKYVGCDDVVKPDNIFEYIFSFEHKKKVRTILFEFRPEIIHIHNYYHVLSPSILLAILEYKRDNKVLVVHTAHDFHLCFPNSGFHYFKNKKLINLQAIPSTFETAVLDIDHRGYIYGFIKKIQWFFAYKVLNLHKVIDEIISPSNFLKQYLDMRFRKMIPVTLIRNPFELQTLNRMKKITESNTIRMVFVGRVSFEKGLDEFLRALIKYKKDFIFDIIGTGDESYIKKLQNLTKGYDNIRYLGYLERDEVLKILQNYDVLVLSSIWYENFPTVMLEGNSLGLRILTCSHGGMKELGEIIGNAYFFDIYNSGSILSAIEQCHLELSKSVTVNSVFFDSISESNYKKHLFSIYNK